MLVNFNANGYERCLFLFSFSKLFLAFDSPGSVPKAQSASNRAVSNLFFLVLCFWLHNISGSWKAIRQRYAKNRWIPMRFNTYDLEDIKSGIQFILNWVRGPFSTIFCRWCIVKLYITCQILMPKVIISWLYDEVWIDLIRHPMNQLETSQSWRHFGLDIWVESSGRI